MKITNNSIFHYKSFFFLILITSSFFSLTIIIDAEDSIKICLKNRPSYVYNGLSIDNSTDNVPKFEFKKTEEELLGEPNHLFEPDVPNNDSENTVSGLPLLPYKGEGRILTDMQILIYITDNISTRIIGSTYIHNYRLDDNIFTTNPSGESTYFAVYLLSNNYVTIEIYGYIDAINIINIHNLKPRMIPLISEKKDGVIYLTFPAVTREYTEYKKLHSAMHVFYCCTEYQKSEILKPYISNCAKPSAKDIYYGQQIGRLAGGE